ncbi:MAG: sulfite exporter TauE/SafE family protein [Arenicellales bacterium]|nr:sulfite exporter TauE/SafE family protein [Arenicellales bacterium]
MPSELTFLAALLVGFLGSTHCIGMCSGIAGTVGASTATNPSFLDRSSYLLLYNIGRISSYVIAGCAAGAVGQIGLGVFPETVAHSIALVISVVFLIALGSYLAGWWSFLPKLELVGTRLWRIVEPWGRKLLPVRNRFQAFLFGCVWGWLPCGLVYSVLAWAVAVGSVKQGALLMLGFGLGTLPTVLCLGMAGQTLLRLRSKALVRQAAGISLVLFAAVMFTMHQINQHA